jgi:beta-glucuronidase
VRRRAVPLLAALALVAVPGAHAAAVPPQRALYADGPSGRYLLDAGWSTSRARSGPYRPVRVPDAFNARDLTPRGFRSRVQWYRDVFAAPPDAPGTTGWTLRFEAVNRRADVWLNGVRLGAHEGGYAPFELRADGLRAGRNELVVRVDGRAAPDVLPPSTRPRGWWNFGGILREVYLRRQTGFDVRALTLATDAIGDPARLTARATVVNTATAADLAYALHVTGPGGLDTTLSGVVPGVAAGATVPIAIPLAVAAPALWSPASPSLYRAQLTVTGGQVRTQSFGIRQVTVSAGRLQLDGAPLDLHGASLHEDSRAHGAALTGADRAALVAELTSIGATATRSHYPLHPALLEAFDRLGIVVWEQVPVWRLTGAQLAGPLGDQGLSLLRQTVTRDAGHPSIVAWSVENETQAGGAGEAAYLRRAAALVRGLDPTRLVAADASLSPLRGLSPALGALDAIGLNEYVGWYGGTLPATLTRDLAQVRARFPAPALVVTETGAEANRGGSAATEGSYAFQARFLRRTLSILHGVPDLSGALVWALRDFPVRPGWTGGNPKPSPPLNAKGIYRRDGTAKPAVAVVRAAR